MTDTKSLWSNTLIHHLFQEVRTRFRFKYVLPRVREVELDGMRFDVSNMPLKVRNRLLNGLYETHEREMCLDYLGESDSVLELGGAIGFIGLLCQKKIGVRNYFCIEANPRTIEILRRNYELNGVEPKIWNLALAQSNGTVELDVGGDFWDNTIVPGHPQSGGRKTIRVPAATLSDVLALLPSPVNTLIADIEGAEQFIDFSRLPGSIQKVIIELHPQVIGQTAMYEIVGNLLRLGFEVVREVEGTFVFRKKLSHDTAHSRDAGTERRDRGASAGSAAA